MSTLTDTTEMPWAHDNPGRWHGGDTQRPRPRPEAMPMPGAALVLDILRAGDPIMFANECGIVPDPWQERVLTSQASRMLLLCSRQSGKSTTCALRAAHRVLFYAPSTVVLASPSLQQSIELFRKISTFISAVPAAPRFEQKTLTRLELANGSRVISLSGNEKTGRGYTADLVLVDEAARCDEELFQSLAPMLATTGGPMLWLSTPAGKRGAFYEQWTQGIGWERVEVQAKDCSRISQAHLDAELQSLGTLRFQEEYECCFHDSETSTFATALIEAAFVGDDVFARF